MAKVTCTNIVRQTMKQHVQLSMLISDLITLVGNTQHTIGAQRHSYISFMTMIGYCELIYMTDARLAYTSCLSERYYRIIGIWVMVQSYIDPKFIC